MLIFTNGSNGNNGNNGNDGNKKDDTMNQFKSVCDLLLAEVPGLTGFEQSSLAMTPRTSMTPPSQRLIIGSIGFAGNALKGAITMAASPSVWSSIAPVDANDQPLDTALLCDMVGELCNMIVGRFRNELLRRGVEVGCATPTTAQCALNELHRPHSTQCSQWFTFTCAAGSVHFRADFSFSEGFCLEDATPSSIEPNVDELMLF